MPIDWKSQDSYQRLLAALVAANDNSIDYKKVAYYFGQGATYDSIEGRFRIAKRMANDLKREAQDEGRQMPTSRVRSTTSTPRKPKAQRPAANTAESSQHSVQSGRIEKSTPSKRNRNNAAAATGNAASAKAPAKQQQEQEPEPQTPRSMEAPEDSQEGFSQDPFEKAFQHSFDDALQRSFFFEDFDDAV